MNARFKAWLPYLLLAAAGLLLTALLQWSEAVYCRRYLCIGRLEQTINLVVPWLAVAFLALGWWAWRRRPQGGLAAMSLIIGGCLALVSAVQISRFHELRPLEAVSLANALAQAARPPAGLVADWDSPAILPLASYLLLVPDTVVTDYVTFRAAGQPAVRGGLSLNVYDLPLIAGVVFQRLVERLPPGRLLGDGRQPAGQLAYQFSRGQEEHLAFLRCGSIAYLWTSQVNDEELAAFAGRLDHWLAEVTCSR